jgi:hypothetical protein
MDDNYLALRDLVWHMTQYLQHLPVCGLGDAILDPTAPGIVITRPVKGCTCGLATAFPLWVEFVWGPEP